ncbi:MAG: sulfatase [Candidatus Hydrogenedentota bacterium]|nr:MAG: sulfatase [Candidatus Hydrogenedentota bacterium]
MYPYSIGTHNMRSLVNLPESIRMYPQYLREAGYYCTNNPKEDYNLVKPGKVWDESSRKAHWKNRAEGQPFFAIFNLGITHESQVRKRPHTPIHDPAKVPLPPYHPDTPEVRRDWAQYYDKMTAMDMQAGKLLSELEEAGLTDDTIIFYYGDHGAGMPRSKRWPFHSGLHVPLIVHIPEKWKHLAPKEYVVGGTSDRLVGFIDLAPTLLSLAGIKPPEYIQGHAYMGSYETKPRPYMFGFRDRMDERYDLVRTVRNDRYQYIRNYMPHLPYGQHVEYMFQTPTTRVWHDLYVAGKLTPPQTYFWETKPREELYDLEADPHTIHNLIDSQKHGGVINELRGVLDAHLMEIRDLGFMPEPDWQERRGDVAPYTLAQDRDAYDLQAVHQVALLASKRDANNVSALQTHLKNDDPAIRYWAMLGIYMTGSDAVKNSLTDLRPLLTDVSPSARITATQTLGRFGEPADLDPALDVLFAHANLSGHGVYQTLFALNALDALDHKSPRIQQHVEKMAVTHESVPRALRSNTIKLVRKILGQNPPG